jgi:hypothetical protein
MRLFALACEAGWSRGSGRIYGRNMTLEFAHLQGRVCTGIIYTQPWPIDASEMLFIASARYWVKFVRAA